MSYGSEMSLEGKRWHLIWYCVVYIIWNEFQHINVRMARGFNP